jgi:hypothetical protein
MDRAGTGLGVPGMGSQSSVRLSSHGGLLLPMAAGLVLHVNFPFTACTGRRIQDPECSERDS